MAIIPLDVAELATLRAFIDWQEHYRELRGDSDRRAVPLFIIAACLNEQSLYPIPPKMLNSRIGGLITEIPAWFPETTRSIVALTSLGLLSDETENTVEMAYPKHEWSFGPNKYYWIDPGVYKLPGRVSRRTRGRKKLTIRWMNPWTKVDSRDFTGAEGSERAIVQPGEAVWWTIRVEIDNQPYCDVTIHPNHVSRLGRLYLPTEVGACRAREVSNDGAAHGSEWMTVKELNATYLGKQTESAAAAMLARLAVENPHIRADATPADRRQRGNPRLLSLWHHPSVEEIVEKRVDATEAAKSAKASGPTELPRKPIGPVPRRLPRR